MTEINETNLWGDHHAVLLLGNKTDHRSFVEETLGISLSSSSDPDLVVSAYESFGIDEARELKNRAYQKALGRDKQLFILFLDEITREAQNALLKLFEDPPQARFVLSVPRRELLLPTLYSRLLLRETQSSAEKTKILKQHIADVLTLIAQKTKAGDTEWIEACTRELEGEVSGDARLLRAVGPGVMLLRKYGAQKGASTKMLLEHAIISYYSARLDKRSAVA